MTPRTKGARTQNVSNVRSEADFIAPTASSRSRSRLGGALVGRAVRRVDLPWWIFGGAFILFLCTLYPGVGGRFQYGDAAKWQYIGRIGGIAHPPGSPLYVIVSGLFAWLPLGVPVGQRVEILSALASALATALISASSRRLGQSTFASVFAALAFATSEATWTFATEAEVYALLGLAVAFVIHRSIVWAETNRLRDLVLMLLAASMGMGVHYAAVALAPAMAAWIAVVAPRTFKNPWAWTAALASLVVGSLPFVALWTRMRSGSAPYSEAGGTSGQAFVDFVLVAQYRASLHAHSLRELWFERSGFAIAALGRSLGPVMLLAPVGLTRGWRGGDRKQRAAVIGLAIVATGALVLIATHDGGDERGESIPALVACVLFAAWALDARRIGLLAGLALTLALGVSTGRELARAAISPMVRDTDEIHDYPFDVECVIAGAENGAVIIPPFADYGARQIVLYHRFVDAKVAERGLAFEWLDSAPAGWAWAPAVFSPSASDTRPVYVFRRDHAQKLTRLGYRLTERHYSDLSCITDHPATAFFRMVRPRP